MRKILFLSSVIFSLTLSFLPASNVFGQAIPPDLQCLNTLNQIVPPVCFSGDKCTEYDLIEPINGYIDHYCGQLSASDKNKVVTYIKDNIGLRLATPTGLFPAGGYANLPVILRWQSVADAAKYEYQIYNDGDGNFEGKPIWPVIGNQSSIVVEYNQSYYWRVRACPNSASKSVCSSWVEATFTTVVQSAAGTGGTQSPSPSTASAPNCVGGTCTIPNPLGATTTFEILLNKIIDFIFWVGITLAPVMFIVAGFMYVISPGSPQKVESAKKMMIYTAIGVIVLLLARGLVKVLESIIGKVPST